MDDFSGLSSKVTIYAVSNDYSGFSLTNPMVPAKYKTSDKHAAVRIGKHVIIGCTSVVLPGITIEEGCGSNDVMQSIYGGLWHLWRHSCKEAQGKR